MGTFTQPIEIASAAGQPSIRLEALVDTGATYLMVPSPILESLGVRVVENRLLPSPTAIRATSR